MTSVLDIEQAAERLRRFLRVAGIPELRLLCGLRFFVGLANQTGSLVESYFREFAPALAAAASKCHPAEFLPGEIDDYTTLMGLIDRQQPEAVAESDRRVFETLAARIKALPNKVEKTFPEGRSVRVNCLFVEHYPDLDLAPRGRLLNLFVAADGIQSSSEQDDIAVRNPVSEPDDRFLSQARDSVTAARDYTQRVYGLSMAKRFRFEFAVDNTGARFTGDSLGVAFAVAAVAALSRTEVFRDRMALSPEAAFSGALTSDGKLGRVDAEALKLKIYRALFAGVKYLVIPREHMTPAWEYLSRLEVEHPGSRLELVGADRLEDIIDDPRLVIRDRSSGPAYVARRIYRARRSVWAQVPALIVLSAVLFLLAAPFRWMPWFDDNPSYTYANVDDNSLDVYNRDSLLLWSDTLGCPLSDINRYAQTATARVIDVDHDGHNEVIGFPRIGTDCKERGWLRFYSYDGRLLCKRFSPLMNKFPGDTAGILFDHAGVYIVERGGEPVVVSAVVQELPARMHIRFWDGRGDSLGWYINWGHGNLISAVDLNSDGKEELLFLCFNNSMHCTALLVLDPDSASGFSPFRGYEAADYEWLTPGRQYGYVLFPRTDIGLVPGELSTGMNYGGTNGIQISDKNLIKVFIRESDAERAERAVIYFLNHDLRVERVAFTDALITRRNKLVGEGKLDSVEDWGNYMASIRDAVTYANDSGFVTEGQLRIEENVDRRAFLSE